MGECPECPRGPPHSSLCPTVSPPQPGGARDTDPLPRPATPPVLPLLPSTPPGGAPVPTPQTLRRPPGPGPGQPILPSPAHLPLPATTHQRGGQHHQAAHHV